MSPSELSGKLVGIGDAVRHRLRGRSEANHLFNLELEAKTAEVREAVWIAKNRQRRHDMVNAFMAVEGAISILARESLSASDRTKLTEVLESGMARLRAMIVDDEETAEGTVSLAQVADSLAEESRWHQRLELAVEPDLIGTGSFYETAAAARQLLSYCNLRTPVTPLALRGMRADDRVTLWIDDRGPDIPAPRQPSSLEPRHRRSSPPATVTGLDVATRLVQQQGGTVRVEPRPMGGMSFGICFPAAGVTTSGS